MCPFEECLKELGAQVSWNAIEKVAIGEMNRHVVEFPLYFSKYRIDDVTKQMSADTTKINGNVYIPISYAAEALGYIVEIEKTASENIINIRK